MFIHICKNYAPLTLFQAPCWMLGTQQQVAFPGPMEVRGGKQTVSYKLLYKCGECWGWVGWEHVASRTWCGRGVEDRKSSLCPDIHYVSLTQGGCLNCTTPTCLLCSVHHPPKESSDDPFRPPLLLPKHLQCLGELGFGTLFVLSLLLKHRHHSQEEIFTFENSCCMKYNCFLLCKFCDSTLHV